MNTNQVVVDQTLCIGAGLCEELDPHVFELNDEGLSQVVASEETSLQSVETAIEKCPSGAISWAAPADSSGAQ